MKLTAIALLPLLFAAPTLAQDKSKTIAEQNIEKLRDEAAAAYANAPVEEQEVKSRGSVNVAGRSLAYTATAGTLTVRTVDGKPTASMFYTAYTLDGTRAGSKRPITFLFNGGPGSPTIWLHMGSFAPVRIRTGNPEYVRPAPYDVGPNPDTLLDKTDLVFLDAIGAGFSRPVGEARQSDFNSVDEDVDVFARAILRYATKYGRWQSPKFVLGESYGTLRGGALAYQLQDRGFALNGLILLSSIMNYGYRQPGLDQVYLNYFPSYAATAWYHNRVPNRVPDVADHVARARAFAVGPYATALMKGQNLGAAERDQIAQQMSELIGISPDFLRRANLRLDLSRFQKELLRDRRQVIGRLDSRYVGVDADAAGDRPETDVSSDAVTGAYFGAFNDYAVHTLGYKTALSYRPSARDTAGWDWNWKHKAPGGGTHNNPNTAVDLAAAMRANPYLKVISLNGWYDMATPFFGAEYDLQHMMLEPAQQRNLSFTYYDGGHMMYTNPAALRALKTDLARFYDEAVGAAQSARPPQPASISAGDPTDPPTE